MKTKNKVKSRFAVALAAASLLTSKVAKAQETPQENVYRTAISYSGDLNNNSTIKSTFGFAPSGSYDGAVIAVKGQFMEYFRAYDIIQESNGKNIHYVPIGLRTPEFSLGGLNTKMRIFGSTGDIAGLGFESEHKIDSKTTLTINVEEKTTDYAQRLGTGLNYQLTERLNIGLGFDNIQNPLQQDQYLVNGIFDFSERNSMGLAFAEREDKVRINKSLGGFWMTSGNKDQWGAFFNGRIDWNSQNDEKLLNGEFYFSKNPSTSKSGAIWAVGRGVNGDDSFNQSVLPLSVTKTETINPYDRSNGGISFDVRTSLNTKSHAGFLAAGVSYFTPKVLLGHYKLGLTVEEKHAFDSKKSADTIEPQTIFRIKYGNHYMGPAFGASIPIAGKGDLTVKGAFLYTF